MFNLNFFLLSLLSAMAVASATRGPADQCIPQIWNHDHETEWKDGPLCEYHFGDFNVISFGDVTSADGGDVQGRLLVGGDLNLKKGFTVGLELKTCREEPEDAPRPYSVVVGGSICWADGSVFPDGTERFWNKKENIFASVKSPASDSAPCRFPTYLAERQKGSCPDGKADCLDGNLQKAFDYFTDLVEDWDAVSQKSPGDDKRVGTWSQKYWYSGTGGLEFTAQCKTTKEIVFRVPNSIWNGATYSMLSNADIATQNVIIVIENDDGKDTVFSNSDFPAPMERTAFVFPNIQAPAPRVLVQGGMQGSIVAPSRTYHQSHGITERGLIVAGEITNLHQANKPKCPLTPYCHCCHICDDDDDHPMTVQSAEAKMKALKVKAQQKWKAVEAKVQAKAQAKAAKQSTAGSQ